MIESRASLSAPARAHESRPPGSPGVAAVAPGRSELARRLLEAYFSGPIAKAIAGAAAKAAARAGTTGSGPFEAAFDIELARLLTVYLPDASRRTACLKELAAAAPRSVGTRLPSGVEPGASLGRPGEVRSGMSGAASTSVQVRDQSDIPNACEVVRDLGKKLGFSRVDQTKMATAVSELARNMLQYAGGGTIRFAEVLAPRRGLEAFFEDHGPGIDDLDDLLDTNSSGLGLRGSRGIADEFLIDTHPGDGTRITMRKYVA